MGDDVDDEEGGEAEGKDDRKGKQNGNFLRNEAVRRVLRVFRALACRVCEPTARAAAAVSEVYRKRNTGDRARAKQKMGKASSGRASARLHHMYRVFMRTGMVGLAGMSACFAGVDEGGFARVGTDAGSDGDDASSKEDSKDEDEDEDEGEGEDEEEDACKMDMGRASKAEGPPMPPTVSTSTLAVLLFCRARMSPWLLPPRLL